MKNSFMALGRVPWLCPPGARRGGVRQQRARQWIVVGHHIFLVSFVSICLVWGRMDKDTEMLRSAVDLEPRQATDWLVDSGPPPEQSPWPQSVMDGPPRPMGIPAAEPILWNTSAGSNLLKQQEHLPQGSAAPVLLSPSAGAFPPAAPLRRSHDGFFSASDRPASDVDDAASGSFVRLSSEPAQAPAVSLTPNLLHSALAQTEHQATPSWTPHHPLVPVSRADLRGGALGADAGPSAPRRSSTVDSSYLNRKALREMDRANARIFTTALGTTHYQRVDYDCLSMHCAETPEGRAEKLAAEERNEAFAAESRRLALRHHLAEERDRNLLHWAAGVEAVYWGTTRTVYDRWYFGGCYPGEDHHRPSGRMSPGGLLVHDPSSQQDREFASPQESEMGDDSPLDGPSIKGHGRAGKRLVAASTALSSRETAYETTCVPSSSWRAGSWTSRSVTAGQADPVLHHRHGAYAVTK